jgi:all-trans-retinol 13,14-reductase
MDSFDITIIGAGPGGLICSNILSKEGFNVCLIEKNHKLGGSMQTFNRKGYVFNTGMNYTGSLDNAQVLHRYFSYLNLLDKIKIKRLNPDGFDIIDLPDGRYNLVNGYDNFVESLSACFPAERNNLKEYVDRLQSICSAIPMYSFSGEPSDLLENRNMGIGAADYIKTVISDNRLRNIIAGNNLLYSGLENKTPLYIHALINNSFIPSAWRMADGSHHLVDALSENLTANGGTIIQGQNAKKLILNNHTAQYAQLSDGRKIKSRYFIANIHPGLVLDMIEQDELRSAYINRIRNLQNTMGLFTLYLIFKPDSIPYVNSNFYHYHESNVWVASHYDPKRWPQTYLFMHSAASGPQEYARSGSVITYMDYNELKMWEHTFTGQRGDDYLDFKEQKASLLLDSVERQFPGIKSKISSYYTSTPLTWRDYTGTIAGSAFGISKDYNHPMQSMIFPRTQIKNLYLTGQNVNMHGLLGVTIGAVLTCGELLGTKNLLNKIKNAG